MEDLMRQLGQQQVPPAQGLWHHHHQLHQMEVENLPPLINEDGRRSAGADGPPAQGMDIEVVMQANTRRRAMSSTQWFNGQQIIMEELPELFIGSGDDGSGAIDARSVYTRRDELCERFVAFDNIPSIDEVEDFFHRALVLRDEEDVD